jgi:hypothetical protein
MKKIHYILKPVCLLTIVIILSSWGSVGHRKINQHAPASLPYGMAFLKTSWTILLANHASDADYRKQTDPNESPKHYIDIDDYPEFVQSGKIPMSWDSVTSLHGESFVIDKGILPWATIAAYDTLKNCFQRKDWNKAGLIASDLGHYVADGHMPLHITRNYNGQYSNQNGIHSRYESTMIGNNQNQINYPDDSALFIPNVKSHVFSYLYNNYPYVDSVLYADHVADSIAGGTSGSTYYSALWGDAQNFTIDLFKRASYALAGLIYTAWVEAGSPDMSPSSMEEFSSVHALLGEIFPNPGKGIIHIPVTVRKDNSGMSLEVYNSSGNLQTVLTNGLIHGSNTLFWDGTGYPDGVYYIVLIEGNYKMLKKVVLLK